MRDGTYICIYTCYGPKLAPLQPLQRQSTTSPRRNHKAAAGQGADRQAAPQRDTDTRRPRRARENDDEALEASGLGKKKRKREREREREGEKERKKRRGTCVCAGLAGWPSARRARNEENARHNK